MTYPDDIFTALENNATDTLSNWVGEYLDRDGCIRPGDDARTEADMIVHNGCFGDEIAEHGIEAVTDALTHCIEAYIAEQVTDAE